MNLVFDIGSNIGRTAEIFKSHFDKVICFEPTPNLVQSLESRFKYDENVIIDSRAISHQNGTQIFNIANANTISTFSEEWINNSRFTGDYEWKEKLLVKTITLSQAILEYGVPDYIKIDTEGYEYEILTNFHELLPTTLFAFEWAEEQKDKIEKIMSHLFQLGYTQFAYTEGDPVLFEDQISWTHYEDFGFIPMLQKERKSLWGMIYFKM